MEKRCPTCRKSYRIDDSKISPGVRFRCKGCSELVEITINDMESRSASEAPSGDQAMGLNADRPLQTVNDQALDHKPLVQSRTLEFGNSQLPDAATALTSRQKIIRTLVILVLILSIHVQPLHSIVFENIVFKKADGVARKWVDDAIARALMAYGTARVMNAVISVIKGSSIHAQPAGVGVSIALGQAVEPLDDLVERFSWIMMISLISLGIQKVMIEICPWLSLYILCVPGLLLLIPHIWMRSKKSSHVLQDIGRKLLLAAFVVRFAVPVVAYLNEYTYDAFLKTHYDSASSSINRDAEALRGDENIDIRIEEDPEAANEGSWWDKLKRGYDQVKQIVGEPGNMVADLKQRMELLKNKASDLIENFIRLSVLFIVNTILLPIGFLWALVKVARIFLGNRFLSHFEYQVHSKIKSNIEQTAQTPKSLVKKGWNHGPISNSAP